MPLCAFVRLFSLTLTKFKGTNLGCTKAKFPEKKIAYLTAELANFPFPTTKFPLVMTAVN